ncbi:hypothetical protein CERZMDRAFT_99094 [Cercospora zeae-maydis SCOH1-5]|uniref:Uncharacterized protein n=1 Tax=Cercospora zeae-maydis SCOH1-5 TaxID=717836 RepID=A0A6A6FC74_9PEZI|nr:hypothetical protein CERZMDRAFT_99094 [Cercospora zeae-maydis SCOH1-5]
MRTTHTKLAQAVKLDVKDEKARICEICMDAEGDASVMQHLRGAVSMTSPLSAAIVRKRNIDLLGWACPAPCYVQQYLLARANERTFKYTSIRSPNMRRLVPTLNLQVNARLNYHRHGSGSTIFYAGTESDKRQTWDVCPATVHDTRSSGVDFTLDKNVVQFAEHADIQSADGDEVEFKQAVYAETAELLQRV